MADRLLDRQVRLLEHLTGGAAIFGTGHGASIERAPQGIHGGLLHLEARFSHEKRMAKIEGVLSRTLDLLGTARAGIIRDFVEACPPVSISRLENAHQFHDFLSRRWLGEPPEPPYLPDVASFELADAEVRVGKRLGTDMDDASEVPRGAIRRHPRVVLLRCAYDIRPILGGRVGESVRRDTRLAVAMPSDAKHPIVSELSPELFDLLEELDDFVNLEMSEFIADLTTRGLVEVRQ